MKRWEPIAYPGPDNGFGAATHRNFNQGTGERGSWPDARGYQQLIDEPANFVELSGFALDEEDDRQIARAARSQHMNSVAAAGVGGTANAVTLAFSPPFANLAELEWAPLRFMVEAAPTGPVTVAVDAIAAAPLRDTSGNQLGANSLVVGQLIEIIRIGASFVLMAGQRLPATGGSTSRAPLLSRIEAETTAAIALGSSTNWLLQFQTTRGNSLGTSAWTGSRLTIGAGEAGLYDLSATYTMSPSVGDIFAVCRLRKNGAAIIGEGSPVYLKLGDGGCIPVHATIPLAVGDYIEAVAYQQSGTAQNALADARSRFVATLISSI